jgi:hypothetical protein
VYATIVDLGGCPNMAATYTLNYAGTGSFYQCLWGGYTTTGGYSTGGAGISLYYNIIESTWSAEWSLYLYCPSGGDYAWYAPIAVSSSPFQLSFGPMAIQGCCNGKISVTITSTPP